MCPPTPELIYPPPLINPTKTGLYTNQFLVQIFQSSFLSLHINMSKHSHSQSSSCPTPNLILRLNNHNVAPPQTMQAEANRPFQVHGVSRTPADHDYWTQAGNFLNSTFAMLNSIHNRANHSTQPPTLWHAATELASLKSEVRLG